MVSVASAFMRSTGTKVTICIFFIATHYSLRLIIVYSINFLMKSYICNDDEAVDTNYISRDSYDSFETTSRSIIGRCFLAAAGANIHMLDIDVDLCPLILPFTVKIQDAEVIFDEIESRRVVEELDSSLNDNDKCEEVADSFFPNSVDDTGSGTINILIETSPKIAVSVNLTVEERSKLFSGCETFLDIISKLKSVVGTEGNRSRESRLGATIIRVKNMNTEDFALTEKKIHLRLEHHSSFHILFKLSFKWIKSITST
jgi:hypothetical protein